MDWHQRPQFQQNPSTTRQPSKLFTTIHCTPTLPPYQTHCFHCQALQRPKFWFWWFDLTAWPFAIAKQPYSTGGLPCNWLSCILPVGKMSMKIQFSKPPCGKGGEGKEGWNKRGWVCLNIVWLDSVEQTQSWINLRDELGEWQLCHGNMTHRATKNPLLMKWHIWMRHPCTPKRSEVNIIIFQSTIRHARLHFKHLMSCHVLQQPQGHMPLSTGSYHRVVGQGVWFHESCSSETLSVSRLKPFTPWILRFVGGFRLRVTIGT